MKKKLILFAQCVFTALFLFGPAVIVWPALAPETFGQRMWTMFASAVVFGLSVYCASWLHKVYMDTRDEDEEEKDEQKIDRETKRLARVFEPFGGDDE